LDATEFDDRYENAVVEMLKRKQAWLPPAEQPEAAAPNGGNAHRFLPPQGSADSLKGWPATCRVAENRAAVVSQSHQVTIDASQLVMAS
jgi:hypothetical protein